MPTLKIADENEVMTIPQKLLRLKNFAENVFTIKLELNVNDNENKQMMGSHEYDFSLSTIFDECMKKASKVFKDTTMAKDSYSSDFGTFTMQLIIDLFRPNKESPTQKVNLTTEDLNANAEKG